MVSEPTSFHARQAYSNVRDPGLWDFRGPDGQPGSVRVPIRLASRSGEFNMRTAIAGEGLHLLPSFYVDQALRDKQLLRVLDKHAWPEHSAYAVYPPTRHLSSRVRAFIDFLVERMAGEPKWDKGLN